MAVLQIGRSYIFLHLPALAADRRSYNAFLEPILAAIPHPSCLLHAEIFAFNRRSSCGVNRKITDNTLTKFGRISLFSKNCNMTLRKYCRQFGSEVPRFAAYFEIDLFFPFVLVRNRGGWGT